MVDEIVILVSDGQRQVASVHTQKADIYNAIVNTCTAREAADRDASHCELAGFVVAAILAAVIVVLNVVGAAESDVSTLFHIISASLAGVGAVLAVLVRGLAAQYR